MALKSYSLPNGTFYINSSDCVTEYIFDNGQPVEIKPMGHYLSGDMRGLPIREYFISPELWDAKWEVWQAVEKKGKVVVVLDASTVKKWGDQIMLTIIAKAYRETWGDKATVDVVVPEGYEKVWENNPHVRNVANAFDKTVEYDKIVNVNSLGLKFRRPEKSNCSDAIINGLGLTLINKTPVYIVSEEETKWAKDKIKNLKRSLIGISLYSAVKSRTYPHMREVARLLEKLGYGIIILDEKIDEKSVFSFREAAAIVNECDLVLTADSAFLHVAGALKKRVVGLFGYTEGQVFTENYEKSDFIQAPCPYGKLPCWWEIKCIPGNSYQEKADRECAHCLTELTPQEVVNKAEEQFTKPKRVLLVMLTYGALEMTKRAVESIRSYQNYDFFVVDNKSTDGTQKWLEDNKIEFVSKKTSVAGAQNIGIEKFLEDEYDHLIFLNNDIVLKFNMLDKLVECAEKSGAFGVMGTQIPNFQSVDSTAVKDEEWTEIADIPAGSYSATLFTRECVEKIGNFNERYTPRYIEDNDYTLRIRGNGGKFVKSHAALFWHFLGAVVKTVEKGHDLSKAKYWIDNIGIFHEMYGFHPHEPQHLGKLGLEWHREDWAVKIEDFLKTHSKVIVRVIRKMGGYGDILFTTVVAKALKYLFGKRIEIDYYVPDEFLSLLKHNSDINGVYDWHKTVKGDFTIDLTDLEFRVELQEMQEYGCIKSARTEIYLDVLGLREHLPKGSTWLKPDYIVTKDEKEVADKVWKDIEKAGKNGRIACIVEGSNKLKQWPLAQELYSGLSERGCGVLILDHAGKVKRSFREAAALVATADLVISPDSGISNLAGALDVPVVTIFSNRNGDNFSKMFKTMFPIQGDCPHKEENYCDFFCPCLGNGPHRQKENIKVPDCLKQLTIKTVLKEVGDLLF